MVNGSYLGFDYDGGDDDVFDYDDPAASDDDDYDDDVGDDNQRVCHQHIIVTLSITTCWHEMVNGSYLGIDYDDGDDDEFDYDAAAAAAAAADDDDDDYDDDVGDDTQRVCHQHIIVTLQYLHVEMKCTRSHFGRWLIPTFTDSVH